MAQMNPYNIPIEESDLTLQKGINGLKIFQTVDVAQLYKPGFLCNLPPTRPNLQNLNFLANVKLLSLSEKVHNNKPLEWALLDKTLIK